MSNQNDFSNISLGCTSLIIKDAKDNIYHGRTLEFSADYPTFVTFFPKGTTFQNKAPDNTNGLKYSSKYSILCLTMPGVDPTSTNIKAEDLCILEGLNSEGVSLSTNMYAISSTPDLDPADYSRALPITNLGDWILGNFKSVTEVKTAIQDQPVWAPVIASIGNRTAPFHFIVYDKTGASIVIEYTDKKLCVYDNPTGVLTNAPELPWHLTNLNNYTFLTNIDVTTSKLGNIDIKQPDAGSSAAALPADDTCVGRFVRAVYYSTFANVANDSNTAILELSHIMNKFDRPKNFGVTGTNVYEYTEWTSLTDLTRGELYFRTYYSLNYEKVSFDQFQGSTEIIYTRVV